MKIVSKNPFEDFYDGEVFDERKALEYLWLCPDFRINATAKLFKWSTTKLYSFLEKVDIKCEKNTPKKTVKNTLQNHVTASKTNTSTEVVKNKNTVKNTPKKTLEDRKKEFGEKLIPFVNKYGKEMIREFFNYWTEHNEDGKLMAFEKTKTRTFSIPNRLVTWNRNNKEKYGTTFKNSREQRLADSAKRKQELIEYAINGDREDKNIVF